MTKLKPYIIGAAAGILGLILLLGVSYVAYKKVKPLKNKIMTKLSDMRFARQGKAQANLSIADFETPEDFKKFADSNVEIELSKEHASSGAYCAKVNFKKGKAPSFKIEHYFEKERALSNWAPYGSFLFDIYNPSDAPQRFILQIKDKSGSRFKQDISLEPNTKETIEIETAVLRHSASIYNISQVNLFRWEPGSDLVVYIDNLRLEPERLKTKKSIVDPEFSESKEPVYAVRDYFYFPKDRWTAGENMYQFPIRVLNPHPMKLGDFPAQGGIPFPKGMLKSAGELELRNSLGNVVDFQARVMARWEDGSIKWLLLNMPAICEANSASVYNAVFPVSLKAPKKDDMTSETSEAITVDTGKIRFSVNKKSFRLFDRVWMDGKEIVSQNSDMVIKFRGKEYRSSLDKNYQLIVEENGLYSTGLKAEGWFVNAKGQKFCKFLVRIKAYKGESFIRVYHTFIFTGYPENKFHYVYKGMRLPKNETIEEASINLRLPEVLDKAELVFAGDGKVMRLKDVSGNAQVFQKKDDAYVVVEGKKDIGSGERVENWIDVSNGEKGVCAIVRKLWQQYPKAFEVDVKEKTLKVKLWPQEAGEMDLKTTEKTMGPEDVARGSAFGLAKTHEVVFYFHKGDYKSAKAREMANVMEEPPLIMADPAWFADTKAMGAVADHAKGLAYFQQYEAVLERLFNWGDRQKKTFKWYGIFDFGDTLSWYRQDAYDKSYDEMGWHPEGRWGWFNVEGMGTHSGALLQFLRTGNYRYFQFGEDLSRHIADVDTCHFNTVAYDKRLKKIYQDYSQPGSQHRHSGDHWGGRNEEASHTNLNGILLYYYITGNDRAFDAAKETGEFFLKHPITYFKHPDIAPNRAMANILMGEVALYEATGDERLKKDADHWANMFYQGQNRNGSFNENYNPRDKRWDGDPHIGYMNGYDLPALIDYHKLTGNQAIKQAIVKLTDYLMAHDEYGAIFEGMAYSYFLTGDKKYLEKIEERLGAMLASQRMQDDPLWNGMIYQKLIYARVAEFLQFTPYAFDALLSSQNEPKESIVDSQ